MATSTAQSQTQPAGTGKEVTNETFDWSTIAIHPVTAMLFGLGVLAVVIGSLLTNLTATMESAAPALYHFAIWSAWGGFILVSLSLMAGGILSQSARPGIRVAMIAIGLVVLMSIPSMPLTIPPLGR